MKVLTAVQMQAVDRQTIDEIGIPGVVLMENAGRGVADEILLRFASADSPRALIMAGNCQAPSGLWMDSAAFSLGGA